jgi:hypothetical protein
VDKHVCVGLLETFSPEDKTVPVKQELRELIAKFCMWLLGFHPRAVHVEFVVDKIALRQVFLRVILFSSVSFNTYSNAFT